MRQSFRTLLHVAIGATVLLLVQWLITHFGPEAAGGVLLANTFATPNMVMRKVARRLVNNTVFGSRENCIRDYDEKFRQSGAKIGAKVTARLPQRYEVTVGAVMNPTPLTDQTVEIEITDQTNIGFEYDSWSATLFVDDYMERYANPAVDTLVNNIDYTGLTRCYKSVAKAVGTPSTVPTTTTPYTLAKTKLREGAVPAPYIAILSADMHGQLSEASQGLFNPQGLISQIVRAGQFSARVLGIDRWYEDENVASHTVGNLGGTPVINGANQTGASLTADGATAGVADYFLEGDVIQIAGVNDINPQSHKNVGRLKDFVVTADVDADGSGNLTIPISPSIITSGAWATCTGSPANDAAITTFGHASNHADAVSIQGLVYNREAFCLVMADLVLPRGLWVAERLSNKKLGVSVRMLKDHDVVNDISPARLDTAHGWKTIRQELACRVCA